MIPIIVIPAQAGISRGMRALCNGKTPAFAGVTGLVA